MMSFAKYRFKALATSLINCDCGYNNKVLTITHAKMVIIDKLYLIFFHITLVPVLCLLVNGCLTTT
jgi:hypothetical protein